MSPILLLKETLVNTKSIVKFSTWLIRHYWTSLALVGLLTFAATRLYRMSADSSLSDLIHQRVLAAGPLPSFEIKRTERLTSPQHQDKVTIIITLGRRADGSEVSVTENRISPDRPMVERVLFFPATGARVMVDDTVGLKSTFYYSKRESVFPRLQLMKNDPTRRCLTGLAGEQTHTGLAEDDSILGNPVVKMVTEGPNRHTRWLSPQLGCIEVMARHDWSAGTGAQVASTALSTPDYIKLGEPDDRLFEVPSSYEEVKPSERLDRINAWMRRQFPEVPPTRNPQANESFRRSADESYAKHRTPAM